MDRRIYYQGLVVAGFFLLLMAGVCYAALGDLEVEGDIYLLDDNWIGLGGAKGRITFDDTPSPDSITATGDVSVTGALTVTGNVTSGKIFYSTFVDPQPYLQMQWTLDSPLPEIIPDKTISFYATPTQTMFYPTTPYIDLGTAVSPYQWRHIFLSGNINPVADGVSVLGSSTYRFKTLWTSENIHTGTSSSNYRLDVKAGGDIGSDTFTGSGLDDMSVGGTFNGTVADDIDYKAEIDSTGTPDTFKWSDDGGSTWDDTTVSITESAQTLNNGITVTFDANEGHTAGDYWEWTVTVHNPMWLQDAAGDGIMYVGNDGKVGIGTTTPTEALDLSSGNLTTTGTGAFGDVEAHTITRVSFYPLTLNYHGFDRTLGTLVIGSGPNASYPNAIYPSLGLTDLGRTSEKFANLHLSEDAFIGGLVIDSDSYRVTTTKTPANSADTGTTGDFCWDSDYEYRCVATNTWKRSALSSWGIADYLLLETSDYILLETGDKLYKEY